MSTAYLTKSPASHCGHKRYPTRTIRLFDSKYIGSFNTHTECVAFVKGVEAVLNYMLEAKDVKGCRRAHQVNKRPASITPTSAYAPL
jgi:hypothetical protein